MDSLKHSRRPLTTAFVHMRDVSPKILYPTPCTSVNMEYQAWAEGMEEAEHDRMVASRQEESLADDEEE